MIRLAVAALVAVALAAPAAWGDADPASDVLLGQRSYIPRSVSGPIVSRDLTDKLDRALQETVLGGHTIKVAVIASPQDLGGIADFFGRPAQYARFLAQEIRFSFKGPLVVVMRAGIGLANVPLRYGAAVAPVAPERGANPDELTRSAILAVQIVARRSGHPIGEVLAPHAGGGGAGSGVVIAVVVLALLGGVAAALALRFRSRPPAGPGGRATRR